MSDRGQNEKDGRRQIITANFLGRSTLSTTRVVTFNHLCRYALSRYVHVVDRSTQNGVLNDTQDNQNSVKSVGEAWRTSLSLACFRSRSRRKGSRYVFSCMRVCHRSIAGLLASGATRWGVPLSLCSRPPPPPPRPPDSPTSNIPPTTTVVLDLDRRV